MTLSVRILICLGAGMALCQCSVPEKKKADPAGMTLQQRSMLKPNENQRSHYEKYMNDPKLTKSSAGSYYQKQMYHSSSFKEGGSSYAGLKQFKTSQSTYGRSKAKGFDMTYALGDKTAGGMKKSFKTSSSNLGDKQAHESGSMFSGADSVFKTGNALTRSKSIGKAPKIIDDYNSLGGKKSAYSEEEVRKLLNRN